MKGILFKPWKILYIAEHPDIEIQTRRVIKLKGYSQDVWDKCIPHNGDKAKLFGEPYLKVPYDPIVDNAGKRIFARYQQGKTVYIKEAYCADCIEGDKRLGSVPCYKLGRENNPASDFCEHWHSPLLMPMRYARYFIAITDVRAERLQEITEEDAIAEGMAKQEVPYDIAPCWQFQELWDSINKDYPFESNPWVWVYTFRREK